MYLQPSKPDLRLKPASLLSHLLALDPSENKEQSHSSFITTNGISQGTWQSLDSLDMASCLYNDFPTATFPIKIVDRPFRVPRVSDRDCQYARHHESLNLAWSFAVLCMMELGSERVQISSLTDVFALSCGNSLYVAQCVLSDPATASAVAKGSTIVRILGNLGLPGLSLIVSAQNLMIRDMSDDYRVTEHAPYDARRQDCFGGVSLHLSLTDWKLPASMDAVGFIDQDVMLREAVVSVHGGSKWIGDIDIMASVRTFARTVITAPECWCGLGPGTGTPVAAAEITSIDNFDELLDPPESMAVVRARGNWVGRLATASIAMQRHGHIVSTLKPDGGQQADPVATARPPCMSCMYKVLMMTRQNDRAPDVDYDTGQISDPEADIVVSVGPADGANGSDLDPAAILIDEWLVKTNETKPLLYSFPAGVRRDS